MRPIKFRAWDNVDYMSTPFTLYDIQDRKIEFTEDAVIMQFTGLLDKNGKEIYEGDIVNITLDRPQGKASIKFDAAAFLCVFPHGTRISIPLPHVTEVIGNIYENSELLGGNYAEQSAPDRASRTDAKN